LPGFQHRSSVSTVPSSADPHLEVERGEEAVRLDLESFEARNGHVKGGWTSILGCLVSGQTHGYLDVVEKGIVEQKELERIWTMRVSHSPVERFEDWLTSKLFIHT
jgi:hypothetical protein